MAGEDSPPPIGGRGETLRQGMVEGNGWESLNGKGWKAVEDAEVDAITGEYGENYFNSRFVGGYQGLESLERRRGNFWEDKEHEDIDIDVLLKQVAFSSLSTKTDLIDALKESFEGGVEFKKLLMSKFQHIRRLESKRRVIDEKRKENKGKGGRQVWVPRIGWIEIDETGLIAIGVTPYYEQNIEKLDQPKMETQMGKAKQASQSIARTWSK